MTDAPPFVGTAALLVSTTAVAVGVVAVGAAVTAGAWLRGWWPLRGTGEHIVLRGTGERCARCWRPWPQVVQRSDPWRCGR